MSAVTITFQAIAAKARAEIQAVTGDLLKQREVVIGLSETTTANARLTVAKLVEQRAEIRANMTAYQQLAQEAKRGSEQQIAANKLAAESAQRLGIAYKEAGAEAARAGGRNAGERGVARGFASKATGIGGFIAGPGFIAGAAAGIVTVAAVKETLREQVALAQLQNALKNTGQSWAANRDQIEKTLKAQMQLSGFSKGELATSMSMLVRVTGNVGDATRLLGDATDVARGRNISVTAATLLMTKAYEGNAGALKKLGIDVSKATPEMDKLRLMHIKVTDANRAAVAALVAHAKAMDKQTTQTVVLDTVEARYHGAALARSKTLQGRIDQLRNTIRELEVAIGEKLIPVMVRLLDWMEKSIEKARKSAAVHKALNDAVIVLRAAYDGLRTVIQGVADLMHNKLIRTLTLVTAAVYLLDAALAANPFLAAATAAIIAAGLIREHWGAIAGFLSKLADGIVGTFRAMWTIVKGMAETAAGILTTYMTAPLRALLEGLSHLPFIGHKFRAALDTLKKYTTGWVSDGVKTMKDGGAQMGEAWSSAFAAHVKLPSMVMAGGGIDVQQFPGGKAKLASQHQTVAEVTAATSYGPKSGAVYARGGGHGGSVTPGHVLDCSGYVYQVMSAAGLQGFPGTSESQWTTDSGPNWTSERINANEAQAGDEVFFNEGPDAAPGHCGLIVGGHGMSALFIEYYSTGHPARYSSGFAGRSLMGFKRFYLVDKQHGRPSLPTNVSGNSATSTTGAPTAADIAAQAAAAAAAKATGAIPKPKKKVFASDTALGEFRQTIADQLAGVSTLADAGMPKAAAKLKAGLDKLRAEAHKGITTADLAALGLGLRKLDDLVKAPLAKARADLRPAAKAAVVGIGQQIGHVEAKGIALLTEAGMKDAAAKMRAGYDKLRAEAKVGMTTADLAALRNQLRKLGDTWAGAVKQAAQRITEHKAAFTAAWTTLANLVDTAFDRATQSHLKTMQRGIDAQLQTMSRTYDAEAKQRQRQFAAEQQAEQRKFQAAQQVSQRAFDAQMQAFDDATSAGLLALGPADQTPTEKLLADRQAEKDSADAVQRLADAHTALAAAQAAQQAGPGDTSGMTPAEVQAAVTALGDAVVTAQKAVDGELYDEQTTSLEEQAKAERTAENAAAQTRQDSYQRQRDAQKQALTDMQAASDQAAQDAQDAIVQGEQDAFDAREQGFKDRYDAAVQAYQDQQDLLVQAYSDSRDAEKIQQDADLAQLKLHLQQRVISWAEAQRRIASIVAGDTNDDGTSAISTPFAAAIAAQLTAVGGAAATLSGQAAIQAAIAVNPRAGQVARNSFAGGGWVGDPRYITQSDTVVANLRHGEFVLTPEDIAAGRGPGAHHTTLAPTFEFNGAVWDKADLMQMIRSEMLGLGRRMGGGTGSIFGGRA